MLKEIEYCTPTFIRVHKIFARFARASLSRIFLAANQVLLYECYIKTSVINVWSRKIIVANQFFFCRSRIKALRMKRWFAVTHIFMATVHTHMQRCISNTIRLSTVCIKVDQQQLKKTFIFSLENWFRKRTCKFNLISMVQICIKTNTCISILINTACWVILWIF